jgi:hypothetical protein
MRRVYDRSPQRFLSTYRCQTAESLFDVQVVGVTTIAGTKKLHIDHDKDMRWYKV